MNHALQERTMLLQAGEELLKIFVKRVPAAVVMLDRDMRYLQVSDRWCADFSLDGPAILGRSHYEIFPDLPEAWKEIHRRALAGEILRAQEDSWERDGSTIWLHWEVRPWKNADGSPGGIIIFSEDITKRKQAEQALSDISRRLTLAQEQERARIGRELHDDINQRLALLSVEIEQFKNHLPLKADEIATRLDAMQTTVVDLSTGIQALSHALHASKLEYLGVVPAMKSFCHEFAKQQQLQVDFESLDVPRSVSPDISLCLFRVLQEALHNAAKHSGTKHFTVQLRGESDEIHLTVSDSGVGFDPENAMKGAGLGLMSMKERVHLVHGELSIDSQPNRGTTIHARVPLGLDSESNFISSSTKQ
jgi:PAS domain S-box-containing protein